MALPRGEPALGAGSALVLVGLWGYSPCEGWQVCTPTPVVRHRRFERELDAEGRATVLRDGWIDSAHHHTNETRYAYDAETRVIEQTQGDYPQVSTTTRWFRPMTSRGASS